MLVLFELAFFVVFLLQCAQYAISSMLSTAIVVVLATTILTCDVI